MTDPMRMIPRATKRAVMPGGHRAAGRLGAEDAGQDEAEAEDDEADLAGHDADRGETHAGGEAVGIRLGPRVADHDRGAQGGGGEERPVGDADGLQRGHDADVHDDLAGAVEDAVHERAEGAGLAGRPGERAVEHVEDAADEDDQAADEPQLLADEDGPDDGDGEADEGQPVGGQAGPAHGQGDGLEDALDAGAGIVGDGHGRVDSASWRCRGWPAGGRRPRRRPRGGGCRWSRVRPGASRPGRRPAAA